VCAGPWRTASRPTRGRTSAGLSGNKTQRASKGGGSGFVGGDGAGRADGKIQAPRSVYHLRAAFTIHFTYYYDYATGFYPPHGYGAPSSYTAERARLFVVRRSACEPLHRQIVRIRPNGASPLDASPRTSRLSSPGPNSPGRSCGRDFFHHEDCFLLRIGPCLPVILTTSLWQELTPFSSGSQTFSASAGSG
jgi:hypothetical protein